MTESSLIVVADLESAYHSPQGRVAARRLGLLEDR